MNIENRVYIGYIDSSLSYQKIATSDLTNKKFFSRDFWKYFTFKFPHSSALIFFANSLNTESRIQSKDSTLLISDLDYAILWKLRNGLPETADGVETSNVFLPTPFFEFNNHEKNNEESKTAIARELSNAVKEDYKLFLEAIKDSKNAPVLVFTKDFQNEILDYYSKR